MVYLVLIKISTFWKIVGLNAANCISLLFRMGDWRLGGFGNGHVETCHGASLQHRGNRVPAVASSNICCI